MASGFTLENINGGSLTVQYNGTATGDRTITLPDRSITVASGIVYTAEEVLAQMPVYVP